MLGGDRNFFPAIFSPLSLPGLLRKVEVGPVEALEVKSLVVHRGLGKCLSVRVGSLCSERPLRTHLDTCSVLQRELFLLLLNLVVPLTMEVID